MVVKNEKEPDPRAKRSRARKKKKKKVGRQGTRAESGNAEIFGALPMLGYLIMINRN